MRYMSLYVFIILRFMTDEPGPSFQVFPGGGGGTGNLIICVNSLLLSYFSAV